MPPPHLCRGCGGPLEQSVRASGALGRWPTWHPGCRPRPSQWNVGALARRRRRCPVCGEMFVRAHARQVYDSDACQRSAVEPRRRVARRARDRGRPARQERGYGAPWVHLRDQVLERDGGRCRIRGPGCTDVATTVAKQADGDRLDPETWLASCRPCKHPPHRRIRCRTQTR